MGWLFSKLCDHRKDMLYVEANYFSGGAISKRVLCEGCGKEIVSKEHFHILKDILNSEIPLRKLEGL